MIRAPPERLATDGAASNGVVERSQPNEAKQRAEDLRKIMIDVGLEKFEESMALWRAEKIYEDAKAKLIKAGYRVLDPFPLADRREIQSAIMAVWREDAEKIGPQALEMYERIVKALKSGG